MTKVLSYLLKEYDRNDTEIFLKAKFILLTTLFVIVGVLTIIPYTAYLAGPDKSVIITEITGLAIMLSALVLLVRGKYNTAIHIILTSGFLTVWGVLFVDSGISTHTKLDTIVFVIGLLSAMPFMFSKTRKPMVLYFVINLILFFIFNYHLHKESDLTHIELLDYFFDNLVVMIFVFLISFNLFSIYRQVLSSLEKELDERKHSENINKALFAISNAVNSTLNLEHLYEQTHNILKKIINADNFFIAILSKQDRTLYFPYFIDTVDKDYPPVREFNPKKSLTGLLVSERKPILLTYDKLKTLSDNNCVTGSIPLIWMGVPLMIKDEVIGVIAVQSYTDPNLYNEQDLRIMSSISDQIAIAIDRKRADDEIRESEKKYRYLFNHAPVGMYEIDFRNGKFTDVNDTFIKDTGYSEEELLSINSYDLLSVESKQKFEKRYQELIDGKKISNEFEYDVLGKDGQTISVILNNDYIYENGKLKGARVVAHNVTERKKIQNMMIQSEKMMSVGGLAAGMAHEINNPLAGIMQNAQLIKNRLTKSIAANDKAAVESDTTLNSIKNYMKKRKILYSIDNILDAGHHAAKIVDNMLSFSRKGGSEKVKCNIGQLLEKTLELAKSDYNLKKKYDFKRIDIITEFDSNIPDVYCEESKIMQVFFNIIKNASESMAEKKEITNPSLVLRILNLENIVQIEIEDNGPGMSEDVRNRIFEPFFTTKDVKKGTGLGLSLSYFIIVEEHQGEINVESTIGKGSNFIIRLPLF